jgi:hypothetical protein
MTDWYVLFGHPERRRWEDARRYGFVSGGGGRRWSERLHDLDVDDRVFCHVPAAGYVGIGLVTAPAVRVVDFLVDGRPLLELPLVSPGLERGIGDDALVEWLVRVRWDVAVDATRASAYWRRGLFYRRAANVAELPADVAAEIASALR